MRPLAKPERLAEIVARVSCATGLARLWEWVQRSRGVTIVRLRLGPTLRDAEGDGWDGECLHQILALIARHYRVIGMDEAAECPRGDAPLPESALVLTTSLVQPLDGIDLVGVAERAGTPIHVSVAPGLLESGELPWPAMIRRALEEVTADSVDMYGRRWPLGTRDQQTLAAAEIIERLYGMPEPDRHARAMELVESWGVGPRSLPGLTWSDVERMAGSPLVSVGALGLTGDSLVRQPIDRVIYELREAKALMTERLGLDGVHMEHPWGDSSRPLKDQIAKARYRSALGGRFTFTGMNCRGENLYDLAAYTLDVAPPDRVRAELCGLLRQLRAMGWKV